MRDGQWQAGAVEGVGLRDGKCQFTCGRTTQRGSRDLATAASDGTTLTMNSPRGGMGSLPCAGGGGVVTAKSDVITCSQSSAVSAHTIASAGISVASVARGDSPRKP
jgi:hypothetical protein